MNARPKLKALDFIAWPHDDETVVMRVQKVHSNGHWLRDKWGYTDQFDSLPRHWRMATPAEADEYLGLGGDE